ncbi:unnamed protein product [Miscanthus lutarioriparius]|uniref:Non-specific lipid-transfer protein n=1 Tax=Miscanthus lutarioriparius TaxID=422564 RepID=A0A811PRN8_9POAL|nr:unnamed protein product [Miscanthus lutarioriparius]
MAAVAFMHGMAKKTLSICHFWRTNASPKAAITSNISTNKKLNRFADPETPIKPQRSSHSMIAAHVQQHLGNKTSSEARESERLMMKKGGAATTVAVVLVVLLAAAASSVARADVSCADVDENLRPCVGYVTGKEAAPAAQCCAGVKRIRTMPSGTADRRQACECVKQAAAKYQPLNADAIRDLPAQCGAPLPFPLTLNFDCTTIP